MQAATTGEIFFIAPQYNLESAYTSSTRRIQPHPQFSQPPLVNQFNFLNALIITMRLLIPTSLLLSRNDPQPRDGGAPNPGTKSRSSSTMALAAFGNENEPQPRDGG